MAQTTTSSTKPTRTTETAPLAGIPEAMASYAEAVSPMLWAIENTRMMLELNRTLIDLGWDMLRQQQDAAVEASLQILGSTRASGHTQPEDSFAGFAQVSLEAVERMAAAMRAVNDPARWAPAWGGEAGRRAVSR